LGQHFQRLMFGRFFSPFLIGLFQLPAKRLGEKTLIIA
jgi:hypothetical protein